MIAVRLSLLASIPLLFAACTSKGSQPSGRRGEGAVPVLVAQVVQKDVPIDILVVGNVEAYSTVTVKAQVAGQLTKVFFREGDYVKKGDQLFTLDQRPFEAQMKQIEANLARDNAQLAQAQANLQRDTANAQYIEAQAARYEKLFQQGIISREQADQMRTNANASMQGVHADEAAIESARAAIAATKAALETARVQFGYTSIVSPIDGRTGSLMVKEGNIVSALSTDLMTINQVQPIYVTFSVPEASLPSVKEHMARGKVMVIATPQDNPPAQQVGVLTFIENTVDTATGTIKLRGTFTNPDRSLWPGEFVRVTLRLAVKPNALVAPNQAVQTGQNGEYVFVVKPNQTVEMRPVVTGPRLDQDIVIEKGVEAGETVVTEGHLRLAPGMRAQVRAPGGGGPGGPGGGRKGRPQQPPGAGESGGNPGADAAGQRPRGVSPEGTPAPGR